MNTFTLYHNPRCSKSRQVLELLQNYGIHPTIVEYLKTPLTLAELKKLRVHFDLNNFVRYDEPIFKELKLSLADEAQVLEAMAKNPILMQRPIVTTSDKAIIARPPEKVLVLLS
jgi:arsenate reductase